MAPSSNLTDNNSMESQKVLVTSEDQKLINEIRTELADELKLVPGYATEASLMRWLIGWNRQVGKLVWFFVLINPLFRSNHSKITCRTFKHSRITLAGAGFFVCWENCRILWFNQRNCKLCKFWVKIRGRIRTQKCHKSMRKCRSRPYFDHSWKK
jgi:hypothetical protein